MLSLVKSKLVIYLLTVAVPFLSLGAGIFKRTNLSLQAVRLSSGILMVVFGLGFIIFFKRIPSPVFIPAVLVLFIIFLFGAASLKGKSAVAAFNRLTAGWLLAIFSFSLTVYPYIGH